jgi:signal transduction histidine kinase
MINLVKNAIKFTQKGEIEIKASYNKEKGLLIIHVRDTGTGIAAEDVSTLFKRWGKLQRTAA